MTERGLDPNSTTMHLHDLLGDSEAEPSAPLCRGRARCPLRSACNSGQGQSHVPAQSSPRPVYPRQPTHARPAASGERVPQRDSCTATNNVARRTGYSTEAICRQYAKLDIASIATGETKPDVTSTTGTVIAMPPGQGGGSPRTSGAGLTPPLCPRTAAVTNLPVGPRPQTLPTRPSVA